MSILFTVFAYTLIDTLITAPDLQHRLVNTVPFILAFISLLTAGLIFLRQTSAGAWIIQIGALVILTTNVTQAEGFGFPAALVILVITFYVSAPILKGQNASVSQWIGAVVSLSVIILDTFWNAARVPSLAEDELLANTLSIALILILLAITLRQFPSFPLRTKLFIISLGTGIVSILVVSVFVTTNTQRTLTQNTRDSLVISARRTMDNIDSFLAQNTLSISSDTQIPQFASFLKASTEERGRLLTETIVILDELSQRNPEYMSTYSLLDRNGTVVAGVQQNEIGTDLSDRDYFLQPRANRNIFISPVGVLPASTEQILYIGAPIIDNSGEFLGILRQEIPFAYIDNILQNNDRLVGEESYIIMLDREDRVLANTANPDWVSRTLVKPDQASFLILKGNDRIFNSITSEDIGLGMLDFATKLDSVAVDAPYFTSTDQGWGGAVEIGVAQSTSNTNYLIAYVLPQAIYLETIDQQVRVTVLVALITGLLILLVSFYVVRVISQPLINLASVAEDIASGNLSTRADYQIQDAIGALVTSFNNMASQLQDSLAGSERRVAERTADVELARLLSERRAQELQSISEISRTISSEQNLETLLPLITRLVSERFEFYHVGIFFIDETRRFTYLQAANSEGGQIMLARGHRLEVGKGLVGTVAETGKPRIALDVGSDAVFFDNPDLPDTRSEMALPLSVRGQTIGVLDVQSTKPGAFTEGDANTLGILGDQVAIAIENARLFGQTQQARDEAEALYSQVLRREWKSFNQQVSTIGYRQTSTGGKSIKKPVLSDEIRQSLESGQVIAFNGKGKRSAPSIAIPVKLRGQTLGVLNIKAPTKDRKWSQDEINLAQAISDRLALALDNARLLQESQRSAAKEAKIGEVSAKISASINMRSVLETAVEELGRALPGSEVVIQFEKSDGADTNDG